MTPNPTPPTRPGRYWAWLIGADVTAPPQVIQVTLEPIYRDINGHLIDPEKYESWARRDTSTLSEAPPDKK